MVEFKVGDKVIPRIDDQDRAEATVVGVWGEYLWLDEGDPQPSTVLSMNCRPPNVPVEGYGDLK
jgi:hypothetical protein